MAILRFLRLLTACYFPGTGQTEIAVDFELSQNLLEVHENVT